VRGACTSSTSARAATEEPSARSRKLLGIEEDTSASTAGGLAEAADWQTLRSPETYLGDGRGERRSEQPDDALALNQWRPHRAVVDRAAEARRARGGRRLGRLPSSRPADVNMVPRSARLGAGVRFFSVLIDGLPPGNDHGVDVDDAGEGIVDQPRMYQLVRQAEGAAERTFEITFSDAGVRAYVFTFG